MAGKVTQPIRIFIGTSAGGEDAEAQAVAEYTIRKYASKQVDITWLTLSKDPSSFWSRWDTRGWGTPFSGLRWGIPAFCGFKGKAVYCDTDVIFRADVAELWEQTIPPGAFALVNGSGKELRTCVMLIDCEAAEAVLPHIEIMRHTKKQNAAITDFLRIHPKLTAKFDGMWNCVDLKLSDGINDPSIKLIHYSSQSEQPHLDHAKTRLAKGGRRHWYDGPTTGHREPTLKKLFDEVLAEATAAGFSPVRYEAPWFRYNIRSYAKRQLG